MQWQLSGLVTQNEALDSLVDIEQRLSAGNANPDSTALAHVYTNREETVIDTATDNETQAISLRDSLVNQPDTIGSSERAVIVKHEAADSILKPNDSLINDQQTIKATNGLLTISGTNQGSKPEAGDSLNKKVIVTKGSQGLLTGNNAVVVPVINKKAPDTTSGALASVQKDTMELQTSINALGDSLKRLDNTPKEVPEMNTVVVPIVNKKAAETASGTLASVQKDTMELQTSINALEDSLKRLSNRSKEVPEMNTVVVPVVNKKVPDTTSGTLASMQQDTMELQARISALEDSLKRLSNRSKEVPEMNTVVVPVLNKKTADTVAGNNAAVKDSMAALQARINTLQDSLKNNTITGNGSKGLLTASVPNEISQPSKDSTKNKPDAGNVSKDTPVASNNDEVARLRAELSSLQKENESLTRQLDEPTPVMTGSPENTNQVSGNENGATQDDINSLKAEIQSLKNTIKENSNNNRVAAPNRSLLPPIVPAIGIGVGKTKTEQVIQHDTIFIEKPSAPIDTVRFTDTVMVRDTIRITDTLTQTIRDTVQQTVVKDSVVTVTNVINKQRESLLALPPFVILFDLGKSNVKLVYRKRLDYYASQLMQHKDLKIVITGHTDKTGSVANNLILSEKRANSISGYLLGKGVSSDAMELNGLGETAPIVENETKDGQSQNRRVELIFKEK